MDNVKLNRPEWMNDEQHAIYRELRKLFDAISDALAANDRETWQLMSLRLREMTRLVNHRMFN